MNNSSLALFNFKLTDNTILSLNHRISSVWLFSLVVFFLVTKDDIFIDLLIKCHKCLPFFAEVLFLFLTFFLIIHISLSTHHFFSKNIPVIKLKERDLIDEKGIKTFFSKLEILTQIMFVVIVTIIGMVLSFNINYYTLTFLINISLYAPKLFFSIVVSFLLLLIQEYLIYSWMYIIYVKNVLSSLYCYFGGILGDLRGSVSIEELFFEAYWRFVTARKFFNAEMIMNKLAIYSRYAYYRKRVPPKGFVESKINAVYMMMVVVLTYKFFFFLSANDFLRYSFVISKFVKVITFIITLHVLKGLRIVMLDYINKNKSRETFKLRKYELPKKANQLKRKRS